MSFSLMRDVVSTESGSPGALLRTLAQGRTVREFPILRRLHYELASLVLTVHPAT